MAIETSNTGKNTQSMQFDSFSNTESTVSNVHKGRRSLDSLRMQGTEKIEHEVDNVQKSTGSTSQMDLFAASQEINPSEVSATKQSTTTMVEESNCVTELESAAESGENRQPNVVEDKVDELINSSNSLFDQPSIDTDDAATSTDEEKKIHELRFSDDEKISTNDIQKIPKIVYEKDTVRVPDEIVITQENDSDTDFSDAFAKAFASNDGNANQPDQESSNANESEDGKQSKSKIWPHHETKATNRFGDLRYSLLTRSFRKGRFVQLPDENGQPEMTFYQRGNELMAYRYLGHKQRIVVPSVVAKLPVRHISGDFLYSTGVVNKAKDIKNVATNNPMGLSGDMFLGGSAHITEFILPEGLLEIPPKLFYYCLGLKSVVIPASVTDIACSAFVGSVIKDIWFNGSVPNSFSICETDHEISIHVRN